MATTTTTITAIPTSPPASPTVTMTTTEQTPAYITSTTTDSISCLTLPTCEQCVAVDGCMYCMATGKNLAACFASALTCPSQLFDTFTVVRVGMMCPIPTTTAATPNNNNALPDQPPAWIFGAAGGAFVALLLLIGAISLACWCNKRNAVQRNSGTEVRMMSVPDSTKSIHDLTATMTGIQLIYILFSSFSNLYPILRR
jgi:hypothetical protein